MKNFQVHKQFRGCSESMSSRKLIRSRLCDMHVPEALLTDADRERYATSLTLGEPPAHLMQKRGNLYSWAYHRTEVEARHKSVPKEYIPEIARCKAQRVAALAQSEA